MSVVTKKQSFNISSMNVARKSLKSSIDLVDSFYPHVDTEERNRTLFLVIHTWQLSCIGLGLSYEDIKIIYEYTGLKVKSRDAKRQLKKALERIDRFTTIFYDNEVEDVI